MRKSFIKKIDYSKEELEQLIDLSIAFKKLKNAKNA